MICSYKSCLLGALGCKFTSCALTVKRTWPINSKKLPREFCWFTVIVGASNNPIAHAKIVNSYSFIDKSKSTLQLTGELHIQECNFGDKNLEVSSGILKCDKLKIQEVMLWGRVFIV